jgi:7-carboxy-7-deazaguanine synthase
MDGLRVTEIFYSLQGETRTVGLPTVFVCLTGDLTSGDWMEMDDILTRVASYQAHYVTVTGSEPLAQKGCLALLQHLCERGYEVSLETGGTIDVSKVDNRVVKVIDIKTPSSGEVEKNLFENLEHLFPHDQIKFVIHDREDYDWSRKIMQQYRLADRCQVLFSPSYEQETPGKLADWIIEDHLPVRLQIQLHKYLWRDAPGR